MNDGAAALVLMSIEKAEKLGIKPVAILRGYADTERHEQPKRNKSAQEELKRTTRNTGCPTCKEK
jgi:acetyl-CoA C-acetyltransferase